MAKIPRFRTEEEIQKFWDIHDSAEYFEDMEDDEVQVTFKREKSVLVIPLGEDRLRTRKHPSGANQLLAMAKPWVVPIR
jgi:hypothetical protein